VPLPLSTTCPVIAIAACAGYGEYKKTKNANGSRSNMISSSSRRGAECPFWSLLFERDHGPTSPSSSFLFSVSLATPAMANHGHVVDKRSGTGCCPLHACSRRISFSLTLIFAKSFIITSFHTWRSSAPWLAYLGNP